MENNKNRKKRISLEDLDKKNIYSVPEAYFDKLSYSIQEKIQTKETSWYESFKISPIRYAVPAFSILLGLLLYFFLKPSGEQIAEHIHPVTKEQLKNKNLKNEKLKQEEHVTTVTPNKATTDNQNETANSKKSEDQLENKLLEENKKNVETKEESEKTVEQYLAEVSKEDIKAYLAMNDLDESQMEELIIEN